MDTMMLDTPLDLASSAPFHTEATPVAAGRLPLMAFVDGETERVLQECSGLFGRCVINRGDIDKAIEYLSAQRSPNLLIVDISGESSPLVKIQNLAEVCEPGTSVVAIGDHNDVSLYRDLIEIGVSNYVVKPLTHEILSKIAAPKSNGTAIGKSILKLGKVISFVGARGGVGTTTLAANFAWHLANEQSRRVALVDLDLQHGDCSLLFNVTATSGFKDALSNPLRLDHLLLDRIMTKLGDRLYLLASEESLRDNIHLTPSAIDTLFSVLRSQFHYVVVDVPRIAAPAYRRALEMADRRVIIVDQTMRSMRDAMRVTKLFDESDDESPIAPDHRNVFVINRVGEAGGKGLSTGDIKAVLQVTPTNLIPFLPKLLTPAAHHGQMAANSRSKFGKAIGTLALELSEQKPQRKWFSWGKS